MKDHFSSEASKPHSGRLNLPVTAALEAETVSRDFLDGNYRAPRGREFSSAQFFADRRALAESGSLRLFPLQTSNAERLSHTLIKVECAARILRNLVERGLSDPQAFAEIGNLLSSAAQTVGKFSSGVAFSQHRNEQRWELSESALKERVLVDTPDIYNWGATTPLKCAVGDALGGALSTHIAADLVSKRRKTVSERRAELTPID